MKLSYCNIAACQLTLIFKNISDISYNFDAIIKLEQTIFP